MSDLKPCPNPWCESDPVESAVPKHGKMYYEVFCSDCGLTAPCSEDAGRAVEVWNTRAAPKVKPLDEDARAEIIEAAYSAMRKRNQGAGGQLMTEWDSIESYVIQETERRILSALTPETET